MASALTGPPRAGNRPRRDLATSGKVNALPAGLGASYTIRGIKLPTHTVTPVKAGEAPLPSPMKMLAGLAGAVAKTVSAAMKGERVIAEGGEKERRHAICRTNACGLYRSSDDRCAACGCWMKAKPWLAAMICPKGFW